MKCYRLPEAEEQRQRDFSYFPKVCKWRRSAARRRDEYPPPPPTPVCGKAAHCQLSIFLSGKTDERKKNPVLVHSSDFVKRKINKAASSHSATGGRIPANHGTGERQRGNVSARLRLVKVEPVKEH